MQLRSLSINHFRCFNQIDFSFDKPIVLIEGLNGSGKTSLLEALHYLCYLRSFRTHSPGELIHFGNDSFFIKATVVSEQDEPNEIQVGLSGRKRLVKINQKAISSYKELVDFYRIVTLTEDDLGLIREGPDVRRLFIDQVITLADPEYIKNLKALRTIVDNRNALLKRGISRGESYDLWTHELYKASVSVAHQRTRVLQDLEQEIALLVKIYFQEAFSVLFNYTPKKAYQENWESFQAATSTLAFDEGRQGRSLFGAHLDDFTILLQDLKSRTFASRGQQKMLILLVKMAQVKWLHAKGPRTILLLDDYMTDFDPIRAEIILKALMDLGCQLIFTTPLKSGVIPEILGKVDYQKIELNGAANLKSS